MRAVRLLLLSALLALAAPLRAQEASGLRLYLNIPELQLRVYDGDRVIRTYPVSVGLPGHDTPDGDFAVQHAEWNPWWRPPEREWARNRKVTPPGPDNPMGRVKLFFSEYYYFHGTPEEQSMGTPASHGCVRMRNVDAIALARLLHERADPTVPPSEIDRILARSRTTRYVGFRAPVPVQIRYEPVVVRDGELRIYKDFYKRNRLHPEAVYQALISAGYDVRGLDRDRVRSMLAQAQQQKGVFVLSLKDGFGAASRAGR